MKYIILDLDSTVVDSLHDCDCSNHVPILVSNHIMFVHLRPGAHEFINKFQSQGYKFIVFSNNPFEYVSRVSSVVFRNLEPPIHLLTEDDMIPNNQSGVKGVGLYFKDLRYVSNKLKIDIDDMIAIDDNINMYPYDTNVIYISPWSVYIKNDDELLKITDIRS